AHLLRSKQPFESGAAAMLEGLDRKFAQATLFHDQVQARITRRQHRNKFAQIRLVANQQDLVGARFAVLDNFNQSGETAIRSEFVSELELLARAQGLRDDFRRLAGTSVGAGKNQIER